MPFRVSCAQKGKKLVLENLFSAIHGILVLGLPGSYLMFGLPILHWVKGQTPRVHLKRLPSVVDTAKGPHCSVYLKKQKKNLVCLLKIIKLFFCQFAVYKTARQHHAIKGNVKVNTCSLDPTVWGCLATSIAFIRYTELCRNLCDSSPVNH